MDGLYRDLLDAHTRGRRTVLVIDEAQDLAPEVLEQDGPFIRVCPWACGYSSKP